MTHTSRYAAVLVSALLLASCAPGSAKGVAVVATSGGSAGATRVWAFSDANIVQTAATYAQVLAARRPELCVVAEPGSTRLTLDAAIANLDAALEKAAGAGALAKLGRTKAGADPRQAETVAVAAVGKGNPGGAVAALLLAHKAEPNEALHLENAAVMATSIGYPQEALALLTEAERLPATVKPGMGIDRTATMLNNRAYALIRLGRYAEAVDLLHQAIAREPLLNEAQRNLAVAMVCLGQTAEAGSALRAGERRNRLQDFGDPSKAEWYDPSQVFDLSKGTPTKLPEVTYPRSLDAAAGAADKFDSDWNTRHAQGKQLLSQTLSGWTAPPGTPGITIKRTSRILDLSGNERATPQIAQLFDRWQASYKAAGAVDTKWLDDSAATNGSCSAPGTDFTKCYESWCAAALPEAQSHWYTAINQSDRDLRAWAAAYSKFASGLSSNLKNRSAHDWVLTDSQYWLISNYALQIQQASTWVGLVKGLDGTCFNQVTPSPAETKDGGAASGIACSDVVGGASFSLDLELFSLSVSCEEVGFEIEAPEAEGGFAEAGEFVSVGHKFGGSTTMFVGVYAKTREIGGLSAGAKGGGYVTWDSQGNVVDIGARAESSIDQSKGPASVSVSGPEAHWSFVGAADEGE